MRDFVGIRTVRAATHQVCCFVPLGHLWLVCGKRHKPACQDGSLPSIDMVRRLLGGSLLEAIFGIRLLNLAHLCEIDVDPAGHIGAFYLDSVMIWYAAAIDQRQRVQNHALLASF